MEKPAKLTTLLGQPAQPLGLAGNPQMEEGCVATAYDAGVNYFFFYNLSFDTLIAELKPPLSTKNRESIVVATGSESRNPRALRTYLSQVRHQLEVDIIDVFYAEYVAPGEDMEALFGPGGVFDELHRWKAQGLIRYVGATAHNRSLAVKLIESGQIKVLMHRYNMAHRGAEERVLPAALAAGIPVVAFTCTRWGSLLAGHPEWDGPAPSAADCYRYVLHHPAVHLALTAPTTVAQLKENLATLKTTPEHDKKQLSLWEAYGKLVYGDGSSAFDTQWP
ncbi:aldo/keto reductase [Candidatus Poribacteria bacterium]|nr:aldo/keto reductase [Candidatus Poribacteria bacterium]